MIGKKLLPAVLIFLVTFIYTSPAESLTRETIRSKGHLFTYSIEPNWKNGPIKKDKFRLIFTFFNDDEAPYELKKITIDKPEALNIKRRPWDGTPLMKPRDNRATIHNKKNKITFKYNEKLRGFVKGKAIKAKFIYIHMKAKQGKKISEPLIFNVHWSKAGTNEDNVIKLKKQLDIESSMNGSVTSSSTSQESDRKRSESAETNSSYSKSKDSNSSSDSPKNSEKNENNLESMKNNKPKDNRNQDIKLIKDGDMKDGDNKPSMGKKKKRKSTKNQKIDHKKQLNNFFRNAEGKDVKYIYNFLAKTEKPVKTIKRLIALQKSFNN